MIAHRVDTRKPARAGVNPTVAYITQPIDYGAFPMVCWPVTRFIIEEMTNYSAFRRIIQPTETIKALHATHLHFAQPGLAKIITQKGIATTKIGL